jgi:hypothetical protein
MHSIADPSRAFSRRLDVAFDDRDDLERMAGLGEEGFESIDGLAVSKAGLAGLSAASSS